MADIMLPRLVATAESREQRLILILADISGYTKFMVENQLSAVHGQMVISFLIETILREVDIPLRLQAIEGDAVFLYAEHPGGRDAWREVLAQIRTKLDRFFEAFYRGGDHGRGVDALPMRGVQERRGAEAAEHSSLRRRALLLPSSPRKSLSSRSSSDRLVT